MRTVELNDEEEAIADALLSENELKTALAIKDIDAMKERIRELVKNKLLDKIKVCLRETTAIIGCGALGSRVADYSWRRGVKLLLIDYDKVERKNLEKQLFFESDIGRFKAEVLAERYNGVALIGKGEEAAKLLSLANEVIIATDKGTAGLIGEAIAQHASTKYVAILQNDFNRISMAVIKAKDAKEAFPPGWVNEGYDAEHTINDTLLAVAAFFTKSMMSGKVITIDDPAVISKKALNEIHNSIAKLDERILDEIDELIDDYL